MTVDEALTPALLDLMEHEKVIEQGLDTFVDVGNALLSIKDGKKYKAAGFKTFEGYCQKRWDISRPQAYRLMDSAAIAPLVSPTGDIPEPRSERQVRPLTTLRDDPVKAAEAWALAVETSGGQPTSKQVKEAVEVVTAPSKPVSKPDLGDGVSHPARFSDGLLPVFAVLLEGYREVLDPFAGTGRIHQLREHGHETVGVELEPEWADLTDGTVIGDARDLRFEPDSFDAICTSPTYGNRLADHHNASDPELRRSYTHDLGRPLTEGNSGAMHWGHEYRTLHSLAWCEAARVLRPGGRFVLNIKDHYRAGKLQLVSWWHVASIVALGLDFNVEKSQGVGVRSLRQGTNSDLRTGEELVLVFDKP